MISDALFSAERINLADLRVYSVLILGRKAEELEDGSSFMRGSSLFTIV